MQPIARMRWRHRFPCSTRLPEDGRRNSATHCDALQGTCWVESWVFRPFGGRLVMAFHGHPSRDSYGRRRQVAVALRESPCPSSRSAAGPRRWGMVSRAMVASGPRQGRITGSGTPQLSSFPLQLCLRIKRSFNPQPRTPSAAALRDLAGYDLSFHWVRLKESFSLYLIGCQGAVRPRSVYRILIARLSRFKGSMGRALL